MNCKILSEYVDIIKTEIKDTGNLIRELHEEFLDEKDLRERRKEVLKFDLSFTCLKEWFVRCSDTIKYRFIQIIITWTPTSALIVIYNKYYAYTMKDSMYMTCNK